MKKVLLTYILLFSLLPLFAQNNSIVAISDEKNIREFKINEKIGVRLKSGTKCKGLITAISDKSIFLDEREIQFDEVKWVKYYPIVQKKVALALIANGLVSGSSILLFAQNSAFKKKTEPLFMMYSGAHFATSIGLFKKQKFSSKRNLTFLPRK